MNETVSLRDVPATIVELAGLGPIRRFPASRWPGCGGDLHPSRVRLRFEGAVSELSSPNPTDPNQGRSPAHRGPLVSLAEGDSFTSATRVMEPRNSSTNATIPTRFTIRRGSRPCSRSCNGFANVSSS